MCFDLLYIFCLEHFSFQEESAKYDQNIYIGLHVKHPLFLSYRGADKPLARSASRCILFDGENIYFDASLFIYAI